MKNLFVFITALTVFSLQPLRQYAQEVVTEGNLVFEVSDIKSDNSNLQQTLKGSTVDINFKGTTHKSEVKMMGGAVRLVRLKNEETRAFDVYLDLAGKQIAVTVPDSVQKAKQKEQDENTNISYDEASTKVIQGYTCYKAKVETMKADGSVKEFELYITDAVKAPCSAIAGLPNNLKGFPLEYSSKSGETTVAYTLKTFNKALTADAMKTPTNYPVMAYKEFESGIGKKLGL